MTQSLPPPTSQTPVTTKIVGAVLGAALLSLILALTAHPAFLVVFALLILGLLGWGVISVLRSVMAVTTDDSDAMNEPGHELLVVDSSRTLASDSFAEPVAVAQIDTRALRVVDLADLDTIRTRIKGVGHYVTDWERTQYGGTEYLLVREPDNEFDANAVAIYGRGRKVGYVPASRAAAFSPMLSQLDADAFRVTGTGVQPHTMVLHVDLPRVPELRAFVRRVSRGVESAV